MSLWSKTFTPVAVWGPTTFTETDTGSAPGGALLKSIAIDFSTLPADNLSVVFSAGDVKYYTSHSQRCYIKVGGTATGDDGTLVWDSSIDAQDIGGFFTTLTSVMLGGNTPIHFLNPNPSGTSYVKLFGDGAAGTAGFRNFAVAIVHDGAITFQWYSGANKVLQTVADIPWNTFPASVRITITATTLVDFGDETMLVYLGGARSAVDGVEILQGEVSGGGAVTFHEPPDNTTHPYADITNPGTVPTYLKFVNKASLDQLLMTWLTITIDSLGPTDSVIAPPPGAHIEPAAALTFVVENDGLPATLAATVTLADGSQELAWDYDQATEGYNGSLDVVGTTRTYTISRKLGFPLGPLSLTVVAT